MKFLRDILSKYKKRITNKINTIKENSKFEELAKKVDSLLNGTVTNLNDSEIADLEKLMNNNEFSSSEKKRLMFIVNVLLPRHIALDDNQENLLRKISNCLKKGNPKDIEKIRELEGLVTKIDELINVIDEKEQVTNISDVKDLLIELGADNIEVLSCIRDIMIYNLSAIGFVENNIYNNTDEDLKRLFEKYRYNYEILLPESMKKLREDASLEQIEEVLKAANEIKIHFIVDNGPQENEFIDILIKGKRKTIMEFKKLCELHGIENMPELVRIYPKILLDKIVSKREPNRRPSTSTDSNENNYLNALFHNFKENVAFLQSKGIDIKRVSIKNPSVLVMGSKPLQRNWHILEDIYKMKITTTSCVSRGRPYDAFDRYIESSPQAVEYIYQNQSKLANCYTPNDFIKLKASERDGNPIIVQRGNGLVQSASIRKEYDEYAKNFEICIIPSISDDIKIKYDTLMDFMEFDDLNLDIFHNAFIIFLETNYKIDDFTYVIGNTRVSRQKVLRICSLLSLANIDINEEEILYALSYRSILDKQDVLNIENFRDLDKMKRRGMTSNE